MLLNDGDMRVSAKDGDFLFIQIGDVDNVNSGKCVVVWFRSLMIEIAFMGFLLFWVRAVGVVCGRVLLERCRGVNIFLVSVVDDCRSGGWSGSE